MRLELNYRSQQAVLDASMALLAPAYSHRPGAQLRLVSADADDKAKTPSADVEIMFPDANTMPDAPAVAAATRAVEVVAVADEEAEAEYVVETLLRRQAAAAPGADKASVAVLYRTNAQSMPIERELIRQGVKYQVVQARPFSSSACDAHGMHIMPCTGDAQAMHTPCARHACVQCTRHAHTVHMPCTRHA